MYAVLPIARDGHLRLHTLENLESAFTRLMTVENSDKIPVFQTKSRAFDLPMTSSDSYEDQLVYFRWLVGMDALSITEL